MVTSQSCVGWWCTCQFNDCTHTHEPGCAVLAALERGEVHPERYASYVKMRLSQDEYN